MLLTIGECADARQAKFVEKSVEQVEELLQHSISITKDIMQAVQPVITTVLPDIISAMGDNEITLAANSFITLDDVNLKIKASIDDLLQRHAELQPDAIGSHKGFQSNKPSRASEMVRCQMPVRKKAILDSPRSLASTEYTSSDEEEQSSDEETLTLGLTSESLQIAMGTVSEVALVDIESWHALQEMAQSLIRMKSHALYLVEYAGSSEKIRARAKQRLSEHVAAWASLGDSCRKHVAAREKSIILIRELSRSFGH
jgi:hypothetical protein